MGGKEHGGEVAAAGRSGKTVARQRGTRRLVKCMERRRVKPLQRAANGEAIPYFFSFDFYSLVVQPSESSSPPNNWLWWMWQSMA